MGGNTNAVSNGLMPSQPSDANTPSNRTPIKDLGAIVRAPPAGTAPAGRADNAVRHDFDGKIK
jgi:hypothetical protein